MSGMASVSDAFFFDTDTCLNVSLCPNIDEFDKADDWKKMRYSDSLVALRCITHALPLSCKDTKVLQLISDEGFHKKWSLNGWNGHIIQPARDAVLDYYKVCDPISHLYSPCPKHVQSNSIIFQRYTEPSDVEQYMRCNSLF